MKYAILILLFISCKSTTKTVVQDIDIKRSTIDKSVLTNEIKVSEIDIYDIELLPFDKSKEVTISDNKGNTKTFTNVKQINIKSKKEAVTNTKTTEKKDVKEVVKDNSKTITEEESISDAVQWKYILFWSAVLVGLVLAFRYLRK